MERRADRRPIVSPLLMALLALNLCGGLDGLAAQEGGSDQPDEGPECCLLLLVPVGARSSALGGSITARTGADAVFRNPAGLAGVEGRSFIVHHSDVSVHTQVDAFSLVFTPLGFSLGASYQLFDNGEIPTTDPFGQPTGELILRDHLVLISFATPLPAGLSAGVNYRFFQQRIDCNGQCGGEESVAITNAIDAGLQYRPDWAPALELGMAVSNVGPGLQVVNAEQSDPLPSRLHLGAAYDVLARTAAADRVALRLSGDVREAISDPGDPEMAVGLELDLEEAVFLRAGYASGEGLGAGAALGVELRYDRFDIAVSRSFVNSQLGVDTEPFQVSFGLHF